MTRTVSRLTMTFLLCALASPAWGQFERSTSTSRTTTPTKSTPSSSDYAASEMSRGTSATQVAAQLRNTYGETDDQMGTILMDAGYSPSQVMAALIAEGVALDLATDQVGRGSNVVGPEDNQLMAQPLADGGHSVAEIVEVLVAVYEADAGMVAGALKFAGFDAGEVAQALRTEMDADANAAAAALQDGGFIWPQILVGLTEGGFPNDLPDYLAALYHAGAPQQYVQSAIEQTIDPETVAHWLSRVVQP